MTKNLILIKKDNSIRNKKSYYLGAWCLQQNEKISSKVVKYPWDNRELMYEDFGTIKKYIIKYEKILKKILNKIHKTSYSYLFWKIQLYPWLGYTIISFFHSFRIFKSLSKKNNKWRATATNINKLNLAPNSSIEFIDHFLNDDWNSYIFGRTMENFKNCHVFWKTRDYKLQNEKNSISYSKTLLLKITIYLKKLFRLINRKKIIFLYREYLPTEEKIKIDYSLNKLFSFDFSTEFLKKIKPNAELRKKIAKQLKITGKTPFDRLLQNNLHNFIPTHLLENFLELKKVAARSTFPTSPKLILTSIGQVYDDPFKYYYGAQPQHVKKFIISHGGYGVAKYCYDEDHDNSICDKYLTWGWKLKKNQIKVGIQKTLNKKIIANKNGGLLFLAITTPKINYTLDSCPRAGQNLFEIQNHIKFFKAVNVEIQKRFYVRAFEHKDQWGYINRWQFEKCTYYPTVMNTQKDLYKVIKKFRVAIVTWNATVVRELFSLDFPTILFWDKSKYETHNGASEAYKKLVKANLLFHDPEKAAEFLNSIWSNIGSWWRNPQTVNARRQFCSSFARPFNVNYFKKLLINNTKP